MYSLGLYPLIGGPTRITEQHTQNIYKKNKSKSQNRRILQMDLIFFFTNVGPNLANNISLPEKDASIYDYLEGEVGHIMFLSLVDDQ